MVTKEVDSNGRAVWRVPSWFATVCVGITLGWIGWVSVTVIDNKDLLAKGGRFTASEGETLKLRVSILERQKIPPEWFEEKVEKLEAKLEKVLDKLSALENHNHVQ